jgi:hypothetical protein
LTPEGHPIDSLHVATAAKPVQTIRMLEGAVDKLKVAEGRPVIQPSKQSVPPKGEPGSLTLHLTARVLTGGAWGEFPAENWIVLSLGQFKKLLPNRDVQVGDTWELERKEAANLLTYFYPATENNDVLKNRIEQQSLKATVISVKDGVARARLDGRLKMKHSFYHKEDVNVVEAKLIGLLDFEPGKQSIRSLRLVTDGATYGGGTFAVALESVR